MKYIFSLLALINYSPVLICAVSLWHPLHDAIKAGDIDEVRHAIENGMPVDITDWESFTALHFASEYEKSEIVHLLIERKANVLLRDLFGKTALHYAATNNTAHITGYLLDNKADINTQNWNGETALIEAAQLTGGPESLVLLLERMANIDIRDSGGATALDWAVHCETSGLDDLRAEPQARQIRKNWMDKAPSELVAVCKLNEKALGLIIAGYAEPSRQECMGMPRPFKRAVKRKCIS